MFIPLRSYGKELNKFKKFLLGLNYLNLSNSVYSHKLQKHAVHAEMSGMFLPLKICCFDQ